MLYWPRPVAGILQQGGQKPQGRHIFYIQYWMYAATGGQNIKMGWPGNIGHPADDGPVLVSLER